MTISSTPIIEIRFPSRSIFCMFFFPVNPYRIMARTPLRVKKHSLMWSSSSRGHTPRRHLPTITAPEFSKSSAPWKLSTRRDWSMEQRAARNFPCLNPSGVKLLWPKYNSSKGGEAEATAANICDTPSSVKMISFTLRTTRWRMLATARASLVCAPRKELSEMLRRIIWRQPNSDSAMAWPPISGSFIYWEVPQRIADIWKISNDFALIDTIFAMAMAPSLLEVDSPNTSSRRTRTPCVSRHNSRQRNTSSHAAAASPVSKKRNVFKLCCCIIGWRTLIPRVPRAL